MSELVSVKKLRTAARNMAKGRPLENHEECNLLLIIADEIEAEIAERFMELPEDADGVPIHVGDEMVQNDKRIGCVTGVGFNVEPRVWVLPHGKNVSISFAANGIVHYKPRTIEDVLTEMLDRNSDGVGLREFNRDFGAFVSHYAAELRGMMEADK